VTENVILDIRANDKKALNSIDKINNKLKRTEKQQTKNNTLFSKMGSILGGIAIVAGITSIAKKTIGFASNLEEAENKLNAVFGAKGQAQINAFAKEYRDSLGMSVLQTKNFIADAGNLFTGFGMGADEARNFSTEVLKLTNDLASFNNLSTEDAQRRMMSALMGESESAKGLGASILETQLKVASLDAGYGEYSNTMDENTKIQIRYHAILMQSKNAVDDSKRSINSYVGQMRVFNTLIERVGLAFGETLLPAVTATISVINDIIRYLADNAVILESVAVAVASVATAYYGQIVALKLYQMWQLRALLTLKAMTIAQNLFNIALRANPIGLVVTAVGALIGALYYLWNTNEKVRYAFVYGWEVMKNAIAVFVNVFKTQVNGIISVYNYIAETVGRKPIDLIVLTHIKGLDEIDKIAKAKMHVADASGAKNPLASGNGSIGGKGASRGAGSGSDDSDSFFQTFSKGSSSKSGGNGTLNTGNINITINQASGENNDALIDRLTIRIANEFSIAGKLAGVI